MRANEEQLEALVGKLLGGCRLVGLVGDELEREGARRPVERRVERGQLLEDEPGGLLLGVGVGAVLNVALAVLQADRRAALGRSQRIAADVNAGVDERLVVGAPGAAKRFARRARPG